MQIALDLDRLRAAWTSGPALESCQRAFVDKIRLYFNGAAEAERAVPVVAQARAASQPGPPGPAGVQESSAPIAEILLRDCARRPLAAAATTTRAVARLSGDTAAAKFDAAGQPARRADTPGPAATDAAIHAGRFGASVPPSVPGASDLGHFAAAPLTQEAPSNLVAGGKSRNWGPEAILCKCTTGMKVSAANGGGDAGIGDAAVWSYAGAAVGLTEQIVVPTTGDSDTWSMARAEGMAVSLSALLDSDRGGGQGPAAALDDMRQQKV